MPCPLGYVAGEFEIRRVHCSTAFHISAQHNELGPVLTKLVSVSSFSLLLCADYIILVYINGIETGLLLLSKLQVQAVTEERSSRT